MTSPRIIPPDEAREAGRGEIQLTRGHYFALAHTAAVLGEQREAERERVRPLPCCAYREDLDRPCDGTMWLIRGQREWVCDTCGGRCGSLAHPLCTPALGVTS